MDVPLSVSTAVIKGREKLSIWYNGKKHVINAPIEPYFYTKERLENIPRVPETVNAIALSNYQKKQFYKYSFSTRKSLVNVRNNIGIEHAFESNIPFILRNRIDRADLFTKFPHTNELKFLFLDIEQYSKPEEMFPTYEDRILSIAWCGNDRDIKCAYLKKENNSDEKLLRFFAEKYNEINPDVIVVYNKNYDIPTIIRRCEKNNIDTTCFSKDKSKPYIGGRNKINIEGVVVYDAYDSAREDQSLTGNVANRGLKEVSDYFGFDSGRKPLDTKSMHKFVGTPELVEYNKDDVERLLVCFDIYWANIEFNANDLKLPLNEVTNLNITNLGLVVIGDEHRRLNIVADGLNKYRYREVFLRKKKSTDPNYEGALIGIFRTGLFEPTYKADYSSLYPSVMSSFNLSPDTTTLLDYRPYTGKFAMKEEDQWYIYNIPDKVINRDMIIQVLKTRGFSAQLVERFLRERAEYKAKWKSTGLRKYRAMSDNRKLKANGGVYGIQGSINHAFGFLPAAIATCGVGRECAGLLKGVLNELYPRSVIEIDSVTGSTPVFVRDKKTKKIDIVPIEDLSDGSLRNVISGVETLTRNGWKNLNYVYCHDVNKNIYTIKSYGARIDVTEDHSLFSNAQKISPKNLVSGDVIDIYPSQDFGGSDNEISKEQAWFLGFFLCDGTITIRNRSKSDIAWISYELKVVKQRLDLLEKAKNILKNDFGLDSKIYDIMKSSSCYKVEVIGRGEKRKKEIDWIHTICYCKDGKTKKVPKEILNAPINVVNAFFDGLTDGDGHIATDEKSKGKWSIDSKFKSLTSGIAYLLDRMHITYNIMTRSDKPHITTIITHKPKKYCSHNVRKGNPGTVSKVSYKNDSCKVYDLGTDDGTFVAGIGRVISHNTDGAYYTTKNHDKDEVKELFEERIYEKFKKDDLKLSIDVDDFKKGYFYKAKNYVLQTNKDKLIFHGAAMKASSKDLISKNLIGELAVATLDRKPTDEIIKKYIKLDFPLKHFAMSVTMGMHMREYKQPDSTLVVQLARDAENHFDIKPELENQYHYIKTTQGYKLLELCRMGDVDMQYYRDQVRTVADMFTKELIAPKISKWI